MTHLIPVEIYSVQSNISNELAEEKTISNVSILAFNENIVCWSNILNLAC